MIDFPFGLNISISVLLIFRLILFNLGHCTKRDKYEVSLLICFSLGIYYLLEASWDHLQNGGPLAIFNRNM